jgi:hypothetical protein
LASAAWIRKTDAIKSLDFTELLNELISNADYGWDQVVYGAIKIGFAVFDGTVHAKKSSKDICDVAVQMLLKAYKVFQEV